MEENPKLSTYLKKPLLFIQASMATQDELFETISQAALELGWTRADFLQRIKEREQSFPTGIQLGKAGAAIPHTDAECVLQEFVAVVTNKSPIDFSSMEDPEQTVKADIIFILGLNRPHAQLEMLQSLIGLLQNHIVLQQLIDSTNTNEFLETIKQNQL
ncbi:PTS sugar transporter subunit IIA [Enterococcus sp. RIT-PI-f]|uniref:PTS sugar transporter subunit IIA n=1 Tax=Enterococcus sp. RIT-PI-f TaxID=1690244 RepID=UPI0006B9087E|nr:PTS sugar transporter subunit IIA [Enterococcus sp. RIT-PI-f]KPG74232.1 PTS fructose transporter subunit IIA [Enterococcus sp. RIT-PI-f]